MPWPQTARYRPHSDVATQTAGDGLIVVHLGRGTTFRLNHTGKLVWELAVNGQTADQIITHLTQLWKLPGEQLQAEVGSLFTHCLNAGVLEMIPEDSR